MIPKGLMFSQRFQINQNTKSISDKSSKRDNTVQLNKMAQSRLKITSAVRFEVSRVSYKTFLDLFHSFTVILPSMHLAV